VLLTSTDVASCCVYVCVYLCVYDASDVCMSCRMLLLRPVIEVSLMSILVENMKRRIFYVGDAYVMYKSASRKNEKRVSSRCLGWKYITR